MRAIFAGQAGVGKDGALHRIADFAREKRGWHDNLSRTEHKAHILPIVFEDYIKREHGSITTVLDSFNDQLRAILWHEALSAANRRIRSAEPDHVFLSMHLSLYRHSNFFTFTDWDELRRFEPDLIITLIDDVYDVWARIRRKTEESQDRTLITLKELYAWRSVECFFAEQLSRNLFPDRRLPHFIVAVKHPRATFDQLLFERDRARVYASFPVTKTRGRNECVSEINEARARLHAEFTVFDPVMIDERILRAKIEHAEEPSDETRIELSDRWPLQWEDCALDADIDLRALYPITIPTHEIKSLGTVLRERWHWQDIDDNIRWRDIALINQSQGVLAYRPRFGSTEPSRGVTRELTYALDVRVIPCHVFSPDEDGDFFSSPFSPSAVVHTSFEEAIQDLRTQFSRDGV